MNIYYRNVEREVDLCTTEPGDVLTYCQKWVAFQEHYMDMLPTIPIYSNVYFDFYTTILQDYEQLTMKELIDPFTGEQVGKGK